MIYRTKQKQNKTNEKLKLQQLSGKNKENFKSNLVLVMTLQSKGLYCCILMSGSRIVSQQ